MRNKIVAVVLILTQRHRGIVKMVVVKIFIAENAEPQRRRDFVIPTICCVSIVRFYCCVKCNSLALKGYCFRFWEILRLVELSKSSPQV